MAYECHEWTADGQKHDCINDEVKRLREERELLLVIKKAVASFGSQADQWDAMNAHYEWLAKQPARDGSGESES